MAHKAQPVEVSRDALGWVLLDKDGHPVGKPDYYKSEHAAKQALKGGGGPKVNKRIDDAIDAGLEASDLMSIASDDVIDRSDIRAFLEAAIKSFNRKP